MELYSKIAFIKANASEQFLNEDSVKPILDEVGEKLCVLPN